MSKKDLSNISHVPVRIGKLTLMGEVKGYQNQFATVTVYVEVVGSGGETIAADNQFNWDAIERAHETGKALVL